MLAKERSREQKKERERERERARENLFSLDNKKANETQTAKGKTIQLSALGISALAKQFRTTPYTPVKTLIPALLSREK